MFFFTNTMSFNVGYNATKKMKTEFCKLSVKVMRKADAMKLYSYKL